MCLAMRKNLSAVTHPLHRPSEESHASSCVPMIAPLLFLSSFEEQKPQTLWRARALFGGFFADCQIVAIHERTKLSIANLTGCFLE